MQPLQSIELAGKLFYVTTIAGSIFIVIGVASSIYSGIPVDVPLDYTLRPAQVDVITPDMNVGSRANLVLQGSSYEVSITDPEGTDLVGERGDSPFSYELVAQKAGEYRILVNNTGSVDMMISGRAETKSSPLGLTGALMLVITGIIVVGLGLRFKKH
jgi:hypothetical protein